MSQDTVIMIPFSDLVLSSKKHQVTFNIKASLDPRYIILGEPIFKRYFVILDYEHNRIGVSPQRTKFVEPLINVVVLIRFVVWIFIAGSFLHIQAVAVSVLPCPYKNATSP